MPPYGIPNISTLGRDQLSVQLERVFVREPALRPRPQMHDYQLTYPPAVQIEQPTARVDDMPEAFELEGLGELDTVALYFHFGFCAYRCRYCYHYERGFEREHELQRRYVEALLTETRRMKPRLRGRAPAFSFLGGGTPTAIETEHLDRFLDGLHATFGAPATKLATVEAKPVTASREKLDMLVQAGFTRINLGIQMLDPSLYAFHHRGEDVRVSLDAIERARAAGFTHVNVDILTGLERQTPESWATTLRGLEDLARSGGIDSVFIYPYHDDPRSSTYADPTALPGFAETAHSEATARAMFERLGWWELGTRFFRSPRHVAMEALELARTRASPYYGRFAYIGLGNSSFSVGDRATWINERDIHAYCARIESGRLGVSHWLTLDERQRAARDVTFDLLYSPHVRIRSLVSRYGREAMASHIAKLDRWADLGLGRWNRLLGLWKLTQLGKLLHLQMIPNLYLPRDRKTFLRVMNERRDAGRDYRGY